MIVKDIREITSHESVIKLYERIIGIDGFGKLLIEILDEKVEVAQARHFLVNEIDSNIQFYKDHINDAIISHELIHCLMYRDGYPKLRVVTSNSIVTIIAGLIENILAHRIIEEIQVEYDIDTTEFNREFVLGLGKNYDVEPDKVDFIVENSFKMLDAHFRHGGIWEELKNKHEIKFPKTYSLYSRIADLVTGQSYSSPFKYRRAMIKVAKELEKVLHGYNLEFDLKKNISYEFVPSLRQLDLSMNQVFKLISKENVVDRKKYNYILASNVSDETCYFFTSNQIFEEEFNRLSVRIFFDRYLPRYSIR